MSTFTNNDVSSGAVVYASDHNEQGSRIAAVLNGGIDDTNISSISGSKITAGTLPPAALDTTVGSGWMTHSGGTAMPSPSTITYNGNRSYDLVFNSVDLTGFISAGMRLRTTRTASAPTQCTSLNGTNQYFNKTSPAGMTFTDDFVVSAWVKLSSYPAAGSTIVSRYNGTSGWLLIVLGDGTVRLQGLNAGAGNSSYVTSFQSVPLDRWVHIAAQLDMSAFTATPTTSYIMFDGLDVPVQVARAGTNPTALIQAGNLEIGSYNAGTSPLAGNLAQVAIFNAKVTQATMRSYISQGFAGTETSLISAYSLSNSLNDLNANANNVTAQGSATTTNADGPFGGQASGAISATLDYAVVMKVAFSTNTTLTVQVPEGCTIPTSGGVSAVAYASVANPYGLPAAKGKWRLFTLGKVRGSQATPVAGTWYHATAGCYELNIPVGSWIYGYETTFGGYKNASTAFEAYVTLSTANNSEVDSELTGWASVEGASGTMALRTTVKREKSLGLAAAAVYYLNGKTGVASSTELAIYADLGATIVYANNAYL